MNLKVSAPMWPLRWWRFVKHWFRRFWLRPVSIIVTRQHFIIQPFVSSYNINCSFVMLLKWIIVIDWPPTWYSGIVMMPVLVQLLRVEMWRELSSIRGWTWEMSVVTTVTRVASVGWPGVGVWQVVDTGRGPAVRWHRGGGRDHTKWPVETWHNTVTGDKTYCYRQ